MDNPPINADTILKTNRFSQQWVLWFQSIARILGKEPLPLASYTVSTLPSPTNPGLIFVSNESGGAVAAFSDGTNWRRVTDRNVVS